MIAQGLPRPPSRVLEPPATAASPNKPPPISRPQGTPQGVAPHSAIPTAQSPSVAPFEAAGNLRRSPAPLIGTNPDLRDGAALGSLWRRPGSKDRTESPEDGQLSLPSPGHPVPVFDPGLPPPSNVLPVPGGRLCEATNCIWIAGLPPMARSALAIILDVLGFKRERGCYPLSRTRRNV